MNSTPVQAVLLAASLVATALAGIRWLRVAQREHYRAGSVSRFARRWWSLGPNRLLGAAAVVALVAAALSIAAAGLVAAAAIGAGPFGLGVRGRTAPLSWTRRLRTLAALAAGLVLVAVAAGWLIGGLRVAAATSTFAAVACPLVVDLALVLTGPVEAWLGRRYIARASGRLRAVAPTVVAITGSYGKTGTKGYVSHLLSGSRTVVPTPASFNNQAGLARAINEHLTPGTEVFVAEMGTYGPGEIAAMCEWVRPDVAVITAVGPVHLERMGSEALIAQAKAEILEQAPVVVLNIDNEWLAALATAAVEAGKKLWRCSAIDRQAEVCVARDDDGLRVFVSGAEMGRSPVVDAPPTNVACAVAVALELGVSPGQIATRLNDLPGAAHRRQVTTGATGATVIDDTYNANPAGAAAALGLLERLGEGGGRRVVVTPGMVELGPRQEDENARFAADAARIATDLVVVGQTNAAALLTGASSGPARVVRVATREQAVAWISGQVGAGDVVLYENDLPDHFP